MKVYTERGGLIGGEPREGHCGCMEHSGFLEGNWPETCRAEITVARHIDQIDAALFDRALVRGLRYWEEVIDVRFQILPQFTREARIWITDAALPGSTLAWSFLANNSCGAALEQRYDTLVDWNEDYLTATIVHEVGHALGLTHSNSRSDIMYPSITMNTIKPSSGDIRRAVNIGYHERTEPVPPIPPVPPTPPTPEPPNMDWLELIKIVLELIEKCQESRGREESRRIVLGRGVAARWALRGKLAEEGVPLAQRRAVVRQYREMSDDELGELLEESAKNDS